MGQLVPVPIPVTGDLNTSDPESNRPAGTLVQATDTHHRYLGPRPGRSRATSAQGVSIVGRTVIEFDGVDDYVLYRYLVEQMVLPLEWTLDVLFEPTAVGSGSGTLVSLSAAAHTDIWLRLDGSAAGGSLPRTVVATVQGSTTSGASGSAVTVRNTTQRTLSSIGTHAVDPALIYHARLVRNGAALSLKVNGTETTGTGLSTTVGHAYAGDGLSVGGYSASLATNYYGGWIYKVLLRSGQWTNLRDGWVDMIHSKSNPVLLSSNGGLYQQWVGSGSFGQETSRFRNFGSVVGGPATDNLTASPFLYPIQMIKTYTDRSGRVWNMVVVNGRTFYQRAT